MRVLVAEDDTELRGLLVEALEHRGLDVSAVSNGTDLIDRLAEGEVPDLLVTDVMMPGLSGIQVALAARSAGLRLPILVMTSLRDARIDSQVRALGPGAALLRKPFGLAELDLAVDARLDWLSGDGAR